MVLVAAAFAVLEVGRGIGEVGASTLVVGRLGAEALPYLFIPLGVISLVASLAYGAALGRVRRGPLFAAILIGVAIALIVERAAIAVAPDVAIPLTWLTVVAGGAIAVTIAWTTATSTFDARQAKRLFPLCTAAAIGGNFVGALAAGPIAGLVGTESLIIGEAALLTVTAFVILRLSSKAPTRAWGPPPAIRRPVIADLRTGFDEVRRSPLLSLIAIAYVLLAVLLLFTTFPFLQAAAAAFPNEVALAAAIGTISAVVTAASFVVSLVVASRFYTRFGVAAAALLLPLAYLVGFGVWIVSFSFATAALVQATVAVTQRGLSNAAWSAFYNTVPAHRRAQVMAFQDGVPGQLGTILSGVLLLTAARVMDPTQVFWLGAVVAAIAVVIALAIRRRYAASLLATLRRGIGEQVLEGGPGLDSLETAPDVRAVLMTALGDPDPRVREMAARLLADAPGDDTLDALLGALDDPDPAVRASSAGALIGKDAIHPEHIERGEAELDRLLTDEPRARTAALHALHRLGREPGDDALDRLLHDEEAAVRAAAASTVDPAAHPDRLIAALEDPTHLVRNAAADRLATAEPLPPGVVERLASPYPAVQAAAVRAMTGHASEVREALSAWADDQVDRAMGLAASRSRLEAAVAAGPDLAFLHDVLEQRRRRHQDLALDALAILDVPEASGVIRRCLRSNDADVRAQAVETLDSVGDRRLGRSIARLVELDPTSTAVGQDGHVLDALRHDDDPWIRILAARSAGDGGTMAGPDTSLGTIERMLELRRVPLFERLDPEDLQRVAAVAEERDFGAGTTIVTEGEVGDELFVILEGVVRVERQEADGSTRQIRTYQQGDHFGELAVLLERPRVASVVADGEVRTLVIGGEGLTSILRERPEAAMAMLQTLAERISHQ